MTTPIPSPDPALDPDRREAQFHRDAVNELISLGMALARDIVRQSAEHTPAAYPGEAPSSPPVPDLAAAFERVSRAVRRTVLLARHLAEPPKAARQAAAAEKQADHRAAARRHLIRDVEDALHRTAEDEEGPLHREFAERLETPELEDEITRRPVAEIVNDILRDLGLDPASPAPGKRRPPAEIRILHARAASHHLSAPDVAYAAVIPRHLPASPCHDG